MSKRLVFVAGVIVAVAAITTYVNRNIDTTGNRRTAAIGTAVFGDFNIIDITKVILKNDTEKISLKKDEEGTWILEEANFPINTQTTTRR